MRSSMPSRRVLRAAGGGGAGEFSGAAVAWSCGAARIGSDGVLRVSGWSRGEVRTGKSEWARQVVGFARFSRSAVQPDRLNSAGLAFGQGAAPLRRPRRLPIRVASGVYPIGEKAFGMVRSSANALCQAEKGRVRGRGVLQALLGSGVRAAPSAGVNGQSGCRPIAPENRGQGEGFSLSCACGVNEPWTLESGGGGVN